MKNSCLSCLHNLSSAHGPVISQDRAFSVSGAIDPTTADRVHTKEHCDPDHLIWHSVHSLTFKSYRHRHPSTTMASQKRSATTASSQQTRAPKLARTTYDSRASGSSQHEPLIIDSDDDDGEEDASQNAPDSTQGPSEQEYSYSLYGALRHKIVGVRYYSGYATVGEMVICRREPNNPYDRNAIRVLNVQGDQIGHIPKTWAAKIAKYMDNRSLLVEATITGPKGEFECPLELKFYGTNEPLEREKLLSQMRADKLPVGPAAERKREEAAAQKERQRLAKEAAKQAKKNGGTVVGVEGQTWETGMSEYMAGSSQIQGAEPGPSLEDIIGSSERFNARNFENVVEEFGVKEDDLVSVHGGHQTFHLTVYRRRCPKRLNPTRSAPRCIRSSCKAYSGCSIRKAHRCRPRTPKMWFNCGNAILR